MTSTSNDKDLRSVIDPNVRNRNFLLQRKRQNAMRQETSDFSYPRDGQLISKEKHMQSTCHVMESGVWDCNGDSCEDSSSSKTSQTSTHSCETLPLSSNTSDSRCTTYSDIKLSRRPLIRLPSLSKSLLWAIVFIFSKITICPRQYNKGVVLVQAGNYNGYYYNYYNKNNDDAANAADDANAAANDDAAAAGDDAAAAAGDDAAAAAADDGNGGGGDDFAGDDYYGSDDDEAAYNGDDNAYYKAYQNEKRSYQYSDDDVFHWNQNIGFDGVSILPLSCIN